MLEDSTVMERNLNYQINEICKRLNEGILANGWTSREALNCLSSLENWLDFYDKIFHLTLFLYSLRRKTTDKARDNIRNVLTETRAIAVKQKLDDMLAILELARENGTLESVCEEIGFDNLEKYRGYLTNSSTVDVSSYELIIDASNLTLRKLLNNTLAQFEDISAEDERVKFLRNQSCHRIITFLNIILKTDELGMRFNKNEGQYYIEKLRSLLDSIIVQTEKDVDELIEAEKNGTLQSLLSSRNDIYFDNLKDNIKYSISLNKYVLVKRVLATAKTRKEEEKKITFQPQKSTNS